MIIDIAEVRAPGREPCKPYNLSHPRCYALDLNT
jgi:hypothetical protein